MGLPTVEHVIFIPVVLLIGLYLGYMLGGRAARADLEQKRRRARE
jgi:uncharacterized protein YneF (UPF0154 family)